MTSDPHPVPTRVGTPLFQIGRGDGGEGKSGIQNVARHQKMSPDQHEADSAFALLTVVDWKLKVSSEQCLIERMILHLATYR